MRAWLGAARTQAFDDALAQTLVQLEALPKMGPPALIRGRWSSRVRKLSVGRTGYLLFYSFHERAGVIEVLSLWHERRSRPSL